MKIIEILQRETSRKTKENGQTRIDVSVAVKSRIDAKALVLCIRGKNLEEVLKSNPGWVLSPKLKAAYRYFPQTDAPTMQHIGVVTLPSNAKLSIEPWLLSAGSDVGDLIGGVYARTSIGCLDALERIS